MRRLLFISFWYPPWNGAGIHRAVKFVRHLPDYGWEPTVICGKIRIPVPGTPAPVGPERIMRAFSPFPMPALRRQGPAPTSATVCAPRAISTGDRIKRALFTPDPQLYWIPAAFLSAMRAIHAHDPVAILATGPPYASFLLGWLLKKMTQIPLVVDYRDLWTGNPWYPLPDGFRSRLEPHLESSVLEQADLVIANHEPMRQALAEAYPAAESKLVAISNGFDEEELGPPVRPVLRDGEPFRIVYAGAIYKDKVRARGNRRPPSLESPYALLRALRRLALDALGGSHPLEIHFFGASRERGQIEALTRAAAECDIEASVHVHEMVPKTVLAPHLRSAHLLLLFYHDTGVAIAQKLYEYMHLEIPLLGLLRNSPPNADILRRSRCGPVVDPEDEDGIYHALVPIVKRYLDGGPPIEPDRSVIDPFDVRALTSRLARHLDRIAGGGSA